MNNDRLRSTLRSTGHTTSSLAEELGVDAKTVQRWVTQSRTPHRQTAVRAARILGVPPGWIWPDLDKTGSGDASGEVVGFYAHRSQVPKNVWLDLLVGARQRIDFLTYASLFLPEDNPETVEIIKHKAATGVKVRMALGDPDSPQIALRGREERMGEGIPGRVRMALAYYRPLMNVEKITFHVHRTTLYNSIYRFDEQMMINQHAFGTYGYMAPILHLRKMDSGGLFSLYERSCEMAWEESYALPAAQAGAMSAPS